MFLSGARIGLIAMNHLWQLGCIEIPHSIEFLIEVGSAGLFSQNLLGLPFFDAF